MTCLKIVIKEDNEINVLNLVRRDTQVHENKLLVK